MPNISEKIVAGLPAPRQGNKLHYFSGAALQGKKAPSGFAVRVTAAGTKSFVWFHRVEGRPYLETIGRWDDNGKGGSFTVLQAISAVRARAHDISKPGSIADVRPARTRTIDNAKKPAGETVAGMLDDFVKRYVEKQLRGADMIRRTFERLVKPTIGNIGIYDLRRSHVVAMLDGIDDGTLVDPEKKKPIRGGPVMADRTLAYLRKAFNWRASRDDDFQPPIVKGMARTKPKERARDRVLTDEEIRDLWKALDKITEPSCYARYVRFLLRTASRREEASAMRWDEIADDIWTIPGARYKNKRDHSVPLTDAARELIGHAPKNADKNPFIFSTTGGELPFSGYSKAKRLLDKKLAELREVDDRKPMPHWTLHDLRRTARSLMSRAGVTADHAERAVGHTIAGVRGVYDRHEYLDEKKKAFDALDTLLDRILKPPAKNVSDLATRRKARGEHG
jgi:integrase